jgi:quinoprotein glucose dehydrogenase
MDHRMRYRARWTLGVFVLAFVAVSVIAWLTFMPDGSRRRAPESSETLTAPATELPPANTSDPFVAIAQFKLPADVRASIVATEPMVANPVAFCFDERGRVYVAETFRMQHAGKPDEWLDEDLANVTVSDRVAMLHRKLGDAVRARTVEHDRIRVLEMDAEGRAISSRVFADGFNDVADGLGSGVLARDGDVWYACVPNLWRLRDRAGDGSAIERQRIHHGYGVRMGYTGHDLHGLRIGPDGKLYFTCGDRGLHVETNEKVVSCLDSGAVLRCNLDGSDLEIYARGLRNPQELAFDEFGNLFTCDNNADFGDEGRWVHVVPDGDSGWRYGYQNQTQPHAGGPWMAESLWKPAAAQTAPYLTPPIANLGTGPAGLTYHPGVARLPARYKQHFFLADFRDGPDSGVWSFALRPKGASFEINDLQQFWWYVLPTDVEFGPDGSLYLTDWIAWEPPKVVLDKGRIYRVQGDGGADDATVRQTRDLLAEGFSHRSIPALDELLTHDDQRVRQEAQFALAAKGPEARDTLVGRAQGGGDVRARVHAIWALGQQAKQDGHALRSLVDLLADREVEVRAQTAKVLGESGYRPASTALIQMLSDDSLRVRYWAAFALGRMSEPKAIAPLIRALRDNRDEDAYLRQAIVVALARIGDVEALREAANEANASVRLGILLAFRRMRHADARLLLRDSDPRIVLEAARAINDEPIEEDLADLASLTPLANKAEAVQLRVVNANFRLGGSENAQTLASIAGDATASEAARCTALRALGNWGQPSHRDLVTGLRRPLAARDAEGAIQATRAHLDAIVRGPPGVVQTGVQTVVGLRISQAASQLVGLARDTTRPASLRAEALKALAAMGGAVDLDLLEEFLADGDAGVRTEARRLLLAQDAARGLAAIERAFDSGTLADQRGAVAILGTAPTGSADLLLVKWLDQLLAGRAPRECALDLLELATTRDHPDIKAKLAAFESNRPKDDPLAAYHECMYGGDADAGRITFVSKAEVACFRCHRVNTYGGSIGPNLSRIGSHRDRRHLLESLVTPDRQITEGYGTTLVHLSGGRVLTGIVVKEDADALHLRTPDDIPVRIPRGEIAALQRGPSTMPSDLAQRLTKIEIRNLVEYLAGLK